MYVYSQKRIERTRILTREEITAVLADLKRRRRSRNTRQNLVIFRLATCCGLRVSEIAGLKLAHVKLGGQRPHLALPAAICKGNKKRVVPLWWDETTLNDLMAWRDERTRVGGKLDSPFVCSQAKPSAGKPLIVRNLQFRWKVAIRSLGKERVADLSIHCGRHSFCSHALAGGRSLVEVRDAAGHSNVATTSIYLHLVGDDDRIGSLFQFQ